MAYIPEASSEGALLSGMDPGHLPQIAALGSFHYKVEKQETSQGTASSMKQLDDTERIHEIAQMLSGSDVSEAAIANAKQLLKVKE